MFRKINHCCMIVMLFSLLAANAQAQAEKDPSRFGSLRFDRTYVRSGPGRNYPVIRVYSLKNVPLEVTSVFDDWRRIRDWDGEEGWILRTQLSTTRTALVALETVILYEKPDTESRKKARLAQDRLVALRKCIESWCKIETGVYGGWVRRAGLWGLYPHELID